MNTTTSASAIGMALADPQAVAAALRRQFTERIRSPGTTAARPVLDALGARARDVAAGETEEPSRPDQRPEVLGAWMHANECGLDVSRRTKRRNPS